MGVQTGIRRPGPNMWLGLLIKVPKMAKKCSRWVTLNKKIFNFGASETTLMAISINFNSSRWVLGKKIKIKNFNYDRPSTTVHCAIICFVRLCGSWSYASSKLNETLAYETKDHKLDFILTIFSPKINIYRHFFKID